MPRNYFTCKQCGRTYISYKSESKFCSNKCKNDAKGKLSYNCDNCGVEFPVPLNRLEALKSGKRKHLYCSKECAIQGSTTKVTNYCEHCGRPYEITYFFKDVQKYCSRECYLAHVNRINICKCCGKEFKAKRKETLYCSKECQISDLYPRIECSCKVCGKNISYPPAEYFKNKNHYCSKDCHFNDITWDDGDKEILKSWYGVKSNYEISQMLSKPYTPMAVKSAATRYGIKVRDAWTPEESQYLLEHYENTPFAEIQEVLHLRSKTAILGKARQYGLKSLVYNNKRWSKEEDELIAELYSTTKTKLLSEKLNRSVSAIIQRANILGVFKDKLIGECYTKLSSYIRAQNAAFHLQQMQDHDFVCEISGVRGNVVIHHIYGFNLILSEAIEISGVELKDDFSKYTMEELSDIYEIFAELQDGYNATVCISKDIHVMFHNQYGYGNNTPEQWEEFVQNNYNNN